MTDAHILSFLRSEVWAIEPSAFANVTNALKLAAIGGSMAAMRPQARQGKRAQRSGDGSIAVIPICGLITHRLSIWNLVLGGTSCLEMRALLFEALNDYAVKSIVLDVDSPGGTVEGVAELAEQIYRARGRKPITAVSNALNASAAYWISSAADEVVVSPSSLTGSIGIYSAHEDDSKYLDDAGVKITLVSAGKYKTEGLPYGPLSNDAREAMQRTVNDYYGMFVKRWRKVAAWQPRRSLASSVRAV